MPPPLALLVLTGRGTLPFEALHGEPLYLHALRALAEAFGTEVLIGVSPDHESRVRREVAALVGVQAVVLPDDGWWTWAQEHPERDLLVHDPLCPLTSVAFLRSLRDRATARPGCSLVSFRPVTDTVKTVVDNRILGTIDREALAALTSPALVPAVVLQRATAAGQTPPLSDFAELVDWLRGLGEVDLVKAPSLARRVDDASAVNLLECVDEIGRRVRTEAGHPDGEHRQVSDAPATRTP